MTYYADLTDYTYTSTCDQPNNQTMLNVGWLDAREDIINIGSVPEEFTRLIVKLCDNPTHLMRGSHKCDYCDALGNGEVRVTDGLITYIAPVLIGHYITEHNYQPPDQFIDAVMNLKEE